MCNREINSPTIKVVFVMIFAPMVRKDQTPWCLVFGKDLYGPIVLNVCHKVSPETGTDL